jgi:carbon storage regulator
MLVLSRKKNEGITIQHPSGDIHLVVVEIRGESVRLGIEADKSVFVHRDEIYNAIQRDGIGDFPGLQGRPIR